MEQNLIKLPNRPLHSECERYYKERPGILQFKVSEEGKKAGAYTDSQGRGAFWTGSAVPGSRYNAYYRSHDGSANANIVHYEDLCRRGASKLILNPAHTHAMRAYPDVDLLNNPCEKVDLKQADGTFKPYYVLERSPKEIVVFPVGFDSVGRANAYRQKGNCNNFAGSELMQAHIDAHKNLCPELQQDVVWAVVDASIEINKLGEVVKGGQCELVGYEYTAEQKRILDKMPKNK
jgi:hypothetical protein